MSASLWLVPFGYILGSIPFGLLIGKISRGVDVRMVGSGNIGATNVLRAAGKGAAAATLVLDMVKGWVPVTLSVSLGAPDPVVAAVGAAAFLGHLYPVFLGFRGGKGVATFLGVLLALVPNVAFLVVALWLFVAALFRFSSLAAVVAAALSPLFVWLLDGRFPFVLLTVILFVFILIRHRENLQRLAAGQERKIGQKPEVITVASPTRNRLVSK